MGETSPGWMHETKVLGPGALRRPRGIGRSGRWEGGLGWKSMADSCQCMKKPTTICKVNSLQRIKINEEKKGVKISEICFDRNK